MNDDRSVRVLAGGLLLLAFLSGAGIGGTVVYARMSARQLRGPSFTIQRPTVLGTGAFLPPGYDQLGLTAEQRRGVREILENTRPHTDSILQQTLPVMREAMDSMQARLRAVLTPEQRRRLDELTASGALSGPSTQRGPFNTSPP